MNRSARKNLSRCPNFNKTKFLVLDEKDFIKGLLDGDSRIFKELVEKYQLPVINTCLGIVHNRQDAEDIAQDVFVEIFRSIQRFRADSKLSEHLTGLQQPAGMLIFHQIRIKRKPGFK